MQIDLDLSKFEEKFIDSNLNKRYTRFVYFVLKRGPLKFKAKRINNNGFYAVVPCPRKRGTDFQNVIT